MFRTKVAIALFGVFAVITAVVYVRVGDHIETEARAGLDRELQIARRTLERVRRLQDYAIVAKAAEVAAWPQIGEILAKPREAFADETGALPNDDDFRYEKHRLMNTEILVWNAKFEALQEGRTQPRELLADWRRERPDLFMVVDDEGIGVARESDRAWFGPLDANVRRDHPSIAVAVDEGRILEDIWLVNGAPMSVAAAPVRHGGRVVGAVVLGYRLTDAAARHDKEMVGAEVAYFVGDLIRRSSTLDAGKERELARLFKEQKLYEQAGGPPREVQVELDGRRYVGYLGPIRGMATAANAGFFVFEDLDGTLARATEILPLIPIAGILGFMLSLGLVLVFFRQHMAPFEEIDQGVMEIINGNLDYWFDVKGKDLPGTMSQNLNIMVCNLSGRPLPEDDEAAEGEHWAEERMFIDEIDPSQFRTRPVDASQAASGMVVPADAHSGMGYAPDILRLVRETDEAYHQRLFREYIEALRAVGEPVQGITFEKFTSKLESNARALQQKYGCDRVRFLVVTSDGKVTLKPVPINNRGVN